MRITKWEYLVYPEPTQMNLNDYGTEGWELVAISFGGCHEWAHLKRPLASSTKRKAKREP